MNSNGEERATGWTLSHGYGWTRTRRAVMEQAAAGGAALVATACGTNAGSGTGSAKPIAGPKEIMWSSYQLGDHDETAWRDTFKLAEQVTGVKTNLIFEQSDGYWDKRQTEFAAGSANLDVMINSQSWVLPGGLNGMFVDHNEYLRATRSIRSSTTRPTCSHGRGRASSGRCPCSPVAK